MEEVPILHRQECAWPFPTAAHPIELDERPLRNLPSILGDRRVSQAATRPILLSAQLPAASGGSAFPSIPDDINGLIPESGIESPSTEIMYPYTGTFSLPAAVMAEREEFSPPEVDNGYNLEKSLNSQVSEQNDRVKVAEETMSTDNEYKSKVQQQLTTVRDPSDLTSELEDTGYLDEHGYLIEWNKTKDESGTGKMAAHAKGEATYFTAIALVALASGNYNQDPWEAQNANHYIESFLDVLDNKSWGNKEVSGETHPIRHPDWVEYYGNHQMRQRPLSKDSFGQIVLGCYYAYKCPNSPDKVREKAKSLLDKWIRYLGSHRWLIHSNHIPNEFEKAGSEYANIFEDDQHTNRVTFVGAETFVLYPHELWALKNCAVAIGVPSESIIPGAAFPFAVEGAIIAPAIEELLRYTGDAIDYLYDRLNYSKKWSLDLVPGWKDSRVRGTFSFGAFGPLSKSQVRRIFETGVRDTVLSWFKAGTGPGSALDNAMEPLLPFLYVPELNAIVRELVNELCPWLDPTVLEQWVTFAISLEGIKQSYKESTAGYAVWPFIMEIESRPYLRVLLEPQLRDLFGFLAQRDNPNGTWAWIAGRHDVVREQIGVFEASNDVLKWRGYAYGENAYNKWIKEVTAEQHPEKFCSRVDYLVLKNLAEKGLPKIPGVLSLSFKGFLDLAARLLRGMLDKIWDDFRNGKYVIDWVDDLQNLITDFYTPDEVSRFIKSPTGELAEVVYRPDGVVQIWKWGASGAFQSFNSLAKVAENGLGHVDDLLQVQERLIDGTLKFWKWGLGRTLEAFGKYIGVPDTGGFHGTTQVVGVVRSVVGEVQQVVRYIDGATQSITNWVGGDINGFAKASQRTAQKVCTAAGELLQWRYHPGGSLKEFSKWSKCNPDLTAEAADAVKQAYRQIDGAIDVVEWFSSGVFDRATTYSASLESGLADAADCVLLQIRDINGILEEWQLDKGVIKAYSRWQHVSENGAGKAVDAVVRIEREGEKIVKHLFKEGIAVHTDVLDEAGNVLSSVGDAISKAWDSITHWHFN